MQKMKLCLVSLDFIPYRSSGLAVYAEKIALGISMRHNVTVVTHQPGGTKREELIDGIRVIRMPIPDLDRSKWLTFSYKAARYLPKLNKEEKFDLVHFVDIHFGYSYRDYFTGSLHQSFRQRLGGDRSLPYHSSYVNLVQRLAYYNLSRFLERNTLRKASRMIAVSNATKKDFVECGRTDPSKIEVIYNGIDVTHFRRQPTKDLREKLGIRSDQRVLLYVGFSTPRKGLEHLADAMNDLGKDVVLIVAGKWEPGYRDIFLRHLGENRDRLIEVGYVTDEEMPVYYSLADVFVLPTLLEGFGFPLVESMSCETPVVSTNVGSVPEVVGDCGLIVPPRDSRALSDAIETLLGDDSLRKEMGNKGRIRAATLFNQERMIEETERFFLNACSR
jgi:glycosyltransferase involved in cell wall biosynthesis